MRWARSLLLVVLPAAFYLGWLLYLRHRARKTGSTDIPALRHGPWFWLILAGLLLAIASLVATALIESGIPAGEYRAPHLEDGRVVPAERRPAP